MALNRVGEAGGWFDDVLADTLQRLAQPVDGLAGTGYTQNDLDAIMRRVNEPEKPTPDVDDIPPPPTTPETKPGDRWVLGGNVVVCGDATSPDAWAQLMQGETAAMVFTDPPYGIDYRAGGRAIHGDNAEAGELARTIAGVLRHAVTHARADAAFYVWHASATRDAFARAMALAGVDEIEYLVWAKPSAGMGMGDYRRGFEPCFYAAPTGATPRFFGDRTQVSLWRLTAVEGQGAAAIIGPGLLAVDEQGRSIWIAPRPPKGRKTRSVALHDGALLLETDSGETTRWEVARDGTGLHPTQKPVELGKRAILNSSLPGEVVADPFLGSGSTLIGAEITGRRCYGLELDPAYCDVIVHRWQRLTGGQAVRTSLQ